MSLTLLGAITTLFQGNAALVAAVPGSPWLDEPKEGTALPYVVVTDVHEETDVLDFERENKVESSWTFRVIGVGEATVESLAGQIDAIFDWSDTAQSPMQVTNRNLLKVIRRHYAVTLDKTRGADARRVTEVKIGYYAEWEEVVP